MMSTQQRLQPFFSILHPLDEPDIGAYKANRCILESSHWIIQMMIRRILWLPSNYFIPAIPARWRKQRPIMWCTSAWRWRWRMPSRAVGPPRLHWVCWSRLYRHLRFLRTKKFGSVFCTKGWFGMNRFCMTWTEPDAWPRALMASSFIVVCPHRHCLCGLFSANFWGILESESRSLARFCGCRHFFCTLLLYNQGKFCRQFWNQHFFGKCTKIFRWRE